jgi:aryl carrier-like protein
MSDAASITFSWKMAYKARGMLAEMDELAAAPTLLKKK